MRFFLSFLTANFLLAACALIPFQSAFAQAEKEKIRVELLLDHETLQPSETEQTPAARIGVLLHIPRGWHTYWQNSGEAAIPTRVSWQLPEGFRATDLRWPMPERFLEKGGITTYGYRDEVLLWADIFTEAVIPAFEQKLTFGAKVSWLVCKEICVPGQQTVQVDIPFSTSLSLQPSASFPLFEKYRSRTPLSEDEARKDSLISSLHLEPFISTPNGNSQQRSLGFSLSGLKLEPGTKVGPLFQVFPYATPGFLFQASTGMLVGSTPVLRLPAKQTGPGEPKEMRGIIVLDGRTIQSKENRAFEWSVPISELRLDPSETFNSGEGQERLTLASQNAQAHTSTPKAASDSKGSLLGALLAAFLAGVLLNLMPCVLPIISIKIMGFVCHSDESRSSVLKASLSFAAGILSSFLLLAIALIALRSASFSVGWGFQFQFPEFVAALLVIVFFLSLSLFDLYTVNLPFMQHANDVCSKVRTPLLKHFFDGVLATALSTPCTAPVLGTALVFAFAQSPAYTILIFLTIGFGLALPYVYFSTHPKLLKLLPNPGQWMFRFRQFMGFLLLGTCVWLLSVLNDLTEEGAIWAIVFMLILYFLVWARNCALEAKPERGRSLGFNLFFALFLFSSAYWLYPKVVTKRGVVESGLIDWIPFSEAVLEDAKQSAKPVFIDFTASWCITCKFNEFRLIETRSTAEALKRLGIVPVKADWTTGDERITKALNEYGAEGVPLYVILSKKGGAPTVLSTLPSENSLLEALQKAVE